MATNTTGGERLYNIMQCDVYNFKLIIIFYEDIVCSLRNLNIVETWNGLTLTLKVTEVKFLVGFFCLCVCFEWSHLLTLYLLCYGSSETLNGSSTGTVQAQGDCVPCWAVRVTSIFSDDTSDVPLGLTHILIGVLILPHIQHITQHVWSIHPLF